MSENAAQKTKTLAAVEARARKDNGQPRFVPSGITADGYEGTRIRKLEVYQARALRISLAKHEINSPEGITGATDQQKKMLARFLGACLVTAEGRSFVPQLFRRGDAGVIRIFEEVETPEIVAAIKKACKQADVFQIRL